MTVGVGALAAVALGNVALWIAARPDGAPTGRFVGELCGAEAVVLFSCVLVLATLIPAIERAFGGLDRVAVWHRLTATAGLALLVPHLVLVTSPPDPYSTAVGHGLGDVALVGIVFLSLWALAPRLRASRRPGLVRRLARATYERWLTAHRLTGLFVGVAVAHAAIVDPSFHRSTLLRACFLAAGGVGLGAYLYRELFARFVVPIHDYTVASTRRLSETTLAVELDPVRRPISFAAGQFVVVMIGGPARWQRHPFTVSSAPSERRLELTIKALGDYTGSLAETLSPGLPARVAGPFGGFDYRHGGDRQIWIAGGIGVTPFVSWIRSLNGGFDRSVDFYYAVGDEREAVYLDEIAAAAAAHPSLRPHLVSSDRDGLLTPEAVMTDQPAGSDAWIYMCGPPQMMHSFEAGFRRRGVPPGRIRWEQFDSR
jgi:predicted ferric reductase